MKIDKTKVQSKIRDMRDFSDYQAQISNEISESCSDISVLVRKEKFLKHKLKKQRIYKKKTHGSWSLDEEYKFYDFMRKNKPIFEDKNLRRSQKIFRKMGKYIKTRSAQQCRSHYQKFEVKFTEVSDMLQNMEVEVLKIDKNVRPEFSLKTDEKKTLVKIEEGSEKKELQKTQLEQNCEPEVVIKDRNIKNSSWALLKDPKEVNTYNLEIDLNKLNLW